MNKHASIINVEGYEIKDGPLKDKKGNTLVYKASDVLMHELLGL